MILPSKTDASFWHCSVDAILFLKKDYKNLWGFIFLATYCSVTIVLSLWEQLNLFLCCFPSNPGCVVFHVNVDYFSFVWQVYTMIFNNIMIANFQTFIRKYTPLMYRFLFLLTNWVWLFGSKLSLKDSWLHRVSSLLLQLYHILDQDWQEKMIHQCYLQLHK